MPKKILYPNILISQQKDLITQFKQHYLQIQKVLTKYEISLDGIPSWNSIKKVLTPEILKKALKLVEPTFLLIPPTTRESKIEAIRKYLVKNQKLQVFTYNIDNYDLWNGGNEKNENEWRASIIEGVPNVEVDLEITKADANNYEMAKGYLKKYIEQGLDVINDADTYLTFIMKSLQEGKIVDSECWTVLNAKNLTKYQLMAYGNTYCGQIYGYTGDVFLIESISDLAFDCLRLRGLIELHPL